MSQPDVDYREEAVEVEGQVGGEAVYFSLDASDFLLEQKSTKTGYCQVFVDKDGTIKTAFSSRNMELSAGLDLSPEQARAWSRALELAAEYVDDDETSGYYEVV
jgi:hypothetical protein